MANQKLEPRNILLLTIEDLNDWIEPLGGHPQAITPNLARLARRAVNFTAAEAPAPACGPSRIATMFGQAPWRTGLYNNKHDWHTEYADSSASIVSRAKAAGWTTYGVGKIFYKAVDDDLAWTEAGIDMRDKHLPPTSQACRKGLIHYGNDFGPAPFDRLPLGDEKNVDWILEKMTADAERTLWGIGIMKPHAPFIVARDYFDMLSGPIVPPPGLFGGKFDPNDRRSILNLPRQARRLIDKQRHLGEVLHETGEYEDFLRAYLASIAFADAQAGRVLDHLDDLGLTDSTLIVMWSDHGWQLGEKLCFRKFTLWERALRVPFMFAGPGIVPRNVSEPVSLLDLYPTVAAAIGIKAPYELDGDDLTSVLTTRAKPRGAAMSAFSVKNTKDRIALTIRTSEYRLIRYWDGERELYDSVNDPFEHRNLLWPDNDTVSDNLKAVAESLDKLLPANPALSAPTERRRRREAAEEEGEGE